MMVLLLVLLLVVVLLLLQHHLLYVFCFLTQSAQSIWPMSVSHSETQRHVMSLFKRTVVVFPSKAIRKNSIVLPRPHHHSACGLQLLVLEMSAESAACHQIRSGEKCSD